MGTTETGPDGSVSYLLTSKNLTYRQKLYRWLIIGCWVLMGYACVGVIVFIDDWGQWRFYGGFAAMGLPLLVLFFSLRFVWALLRRLVRVVCGRASGAWWHPSWDSGSLVACCGWSGLSRSCTSGPT